MATWNAGGGTTMNRSPRPLDAGCGSAMLAWETGPKSCDGIWARHWFDAVWKSTGLAAYRSRPGNVPTTLAGVLEEVQPIYNALAADRVR